MQNLENKTSVSEEEIRLLQEKDSLFEWRKSKTEGILLKSKARSASQGQKVSKYFCGLEKRHFVSKQMFKLFSKHGKCLDDTEEMLQEAETFYQQLYSEKNNNSMRR